MTKLIIDEKVKKEILSESRRGYQQGVAYICACHKDEDESTEAWVEVQASSNFSFRNPDCRILLCISDRNGHGGMVGTMIDQDIPGHSEIASFWQTSAGSDAKEEYEAMDDPSQKEIDAWVEKWEKEGAFFHQDDVDGEVWSRVVDALSEGGYSVELIE